MIIVAHFFAQRLSFLTYLICSGNEKTEIHQKIASQMLGEVRRTILHSPFKTKPN